MTFPYLASLMTDVGTFLDERMSFVLHEKFGTRMIQESTLNSTGMLLSWKRISEFFFKLWIKITGMTPKLSQENSWIICIRDRGFAKWRREGKTCQCGLRGKFGFGKVRDEVSSQESDDMIEETERAYCRHGFQMSMYRTSEFRETQKSRMVDYL